MTVIKTDQEIYDDLICSDFNRAQVDYTTEDRNQIEELLLNCSNHEVDFVEGYDNRPEALLLQLIDPKGIFWVMNIGIGEDVEDPDLNDFRIIVGKSHCINRKEGK